MSVRGAFVCRDCGCRVSPGSFRASCPECDGRLGVTDAAERTRGE